jgi:hypothetical protein
MASQSDMITRTIRSVIIFIIVSLPLTYKITNRLLGGIIGKLADASGCPTGLGIFVHSVVFGLIIYSFMAFSPF